MATDESDLLAGLFAQVVPEIASGDIEIKAIARKPGSRSKLALYSHDPNVDAVDACVGLRGARIKKIVDRLGSERIDLIRWQESPERFIAHALQPMRIADVILHPEQHRAVVVVTSNQTWLTKSRREENRELASRLCGWQIEFKEE